MFMMNETHRMYMRTYGTLAARVFIGALFVLAGYGKVTGFAGTAGYIASAGLPFAELLTLLAIILEIGGGVLIILGYRIGLGAGALILFTLATLIFFHAPSTWAEAPQQQTTFMKNLALIGGLLYILAYGAGEGWALGKRRTLVPSL